MLAFPFYDARDTGIAGVREKSKHSNVRLARAISVNQNGFPAGLISFTSDQMLDYYEKKNAPIAFIYEVAKKVNGHLYLTAIEKRT